jgi:hypothetical protein
MEFGRIYIIAFKETCHIGTLSKTNPSTVDERRNACNNIGKQWLSS